MAQQLTDLVEQFCNFQRKQRGKTEGGVRTYRWILEQFLIFVRNRYGRLARVTDLTSPTIQDGDVIRPGTLRFPYAETAERAPISCLFLGDTRLGEGRTISLFCR